jgi:hypothetical protein
VEDQKVLCHIAFLLICASKSSLSRCALLLLTSLSSGEVLCDLSLSLCKWFAPPRACFLSLQGRVCSWVPEDEREAGPLSFRLPLYA